MSLNAGTRLGPYEILSALGAGGMGEVYRARDTKLDRDVAIKVLPELFVADPERVARFQREAKVLASLNHLNIAAIYGFEDADGIHALVMELVEGLTLADLIAKGPMSPIEALPLAKQIAEALEAAHNQGIIHRDLKPANIKVRDDGTVKVLDFGLAKVAAQDGGDTDLTRSPTVRVLATRAGVILGTAEYMSPEQARGKAVDKRSDVWAFGCVLYEMLTGCRPFRGESVVDVLASILEREPDWSVLPTGTPETLRLLLLRCLAKDPKQRLRDIGDARLEFSHAIASRFRDDRASGANTAPRARLSVWLVAAGAAVALLSLTTIAIVLARQASRSSPTATEPPLQLTDFSDSVVMPALSHDGRILAFIRGTDFGRTAPTEGRVYVKLLPNGDPVELTHGEGGGFPMFSPDDSHVVYTMVMPGLKWDSWQVPVLGGSPQPFLANASGLNWVDTHRLVYSSIKSGLYMGIVTSDPSQTDRKEIYFPASEGGMAHRSFPSPDRASLLVVEMDRGTWQPCRLVPLDRSSSPGRPVGPQRAQCTSAAWSPDGRWMYFSSNAGGAFHIWRQRHPDGEPEQITFGPTEQEGTAIMPDGQYLITAMGLYRATIWMHDASGVRPLTDSGYTVRPAMVPSGTRLFYPMRTEASQGQASGELWSTDLNSRSKQRLFPGLVMTHYVLSQDGKKILFTSSGHDGGDGIWIADLDRRTPPRQLTRNAESRAFFGAPGEIVYLSDKGHLYRMHEDGSGAEMISPDPLVYLMAVSPDGKWAGVIAPAREDGGGTKAELRSLRGEAIEVCNARCGFGPASLRYTSPVTWSLDGKWLFVSLGFFRAGAGRTVMLPYRSDVPPDRLWPMGLTSEDAVAANPGARILEDAGAFPASDPETYLTWRPSFQSNLYRIRLSR